MIMTFSLANTIGESYILRTATATFCFISVYNRSTQQQIWHLLHEIIVSVCDEYDWSIHMGQLAEVASVSEDAIPKLLWPFEVAGHWWHIFPQDSTAWLQLKHRGWIHLADEVS